MSEFQETIGSSDSSCFSLVQPGKSRSLDSLAYCTDADNNVVAITAPLFVVQRSDFRRYRSHEIPMRLLLSYEGKRALSVSVTELDVLPNSTVSNTHTKPAPSRIPSDAIAALKIKQKTPKYPKEAKKKHISGTVLLMALITKHGTIADLDVIASPDPRLTEAAREAVQGWTYRPYLLNGEPVEVDTTIDVNFSLGKE